MTVLKRYLLALAGFLAVSAVISVLADFLSPLFSPTVVFAGSEQEQIDAWEKRMFLTINLLTSVQNFLSFGVGAFLLRRSPFVPGLLLYFATAIPIVMILHSIAVVADSSVTYIDIVTANLVGWIAGFVAAVVGMVVGYWIARHRGRGTPAQTSIGVKSLW